MGQEVLGYKISVDGEQARGSVGTFKKELREATQNLIAMNEKFGEASVQARNAAKRVAELKDRIGDAKSMAEAFNPDARFKAVSQSVQGIAGAFASVQGAMGLMGVESKNLQEQLLRVQSALAFSEGLNTFLDSGIQGFKNLKAVASDFATNLMKNFGTGGIAVLVGGLAVAVVQLYEALKKESEIDRLINEEGIKSKKIKDDLIQSTSQEIAKAKMLYIAASDVNVSQRKRKEAVEELQKLYPAYFGNIKEEEFLTGKAKVGYDALTNSLIKSIEVKAKEKDLIETISKRVELEQQLQDLSKQEEGTFKYVDQALIDKTKRELDFYKKKEESLLKLNKIETESAQSSYGTIGTGQTGKFSLSEKEKAEGEKRKQIMDEVNKIISEENMNARQKELKDLEIKFKEESKLFKVGSADRIKLEEAYRIQKKEINDKYDKDDKEKADKILREIMDGEEAKLNSVIDNTSMLFSVRKDAINAEQQLLDDAYKNKLISEKEYTEKSNALSDKRKQIAKSEKDVKIQSWNEISGAMGMLAGAMDADSDLQKGFALTQLGIDTGIAISGLTASTSAASADNVATGGIAGFAKYAVGIAKILANIAQARRLIMGANKSGGEGASGGSAPVNPMIPVQQTITQLNANSINAMGNQAIKAYVVESDITGSQNRVQRILNSSRFK